MHIADERHVVTLVGDGGEMAIAEGFMNADGDPLASLRSDVVDACGTQGAKAFDIAFAKVETMPGAPVTDTVACDDIVIRVTRTIHEIR